MPSQHRDANKLGNYASYQQSYIASMSYKHKISISARKTTEIITDFIELKYTISLESSEKASIGRKHKWHE